jgi:putative alpha-1,2-mannosidase
VIESLNNSAQNIYVQDLKWNGISSTKNFLRHSELIKGGKLQFSMGRSPNKKRGIEIADYPYSFSTENK